METSRGGVGASAELSARVQFGEDNLDTSEFGLGLNVHRDSSAVIRHGHRAIRRQRHIDPAAMPSEGFVDAVVEDLPEAVHQPFGVVGADVHAGSLPDCIKTLKNGEVFG